MLRTQIRGHKLYTGQLPINIRKFKNLFSFKKVKFVIKIYEKKTKITADGKETIKIKYGIWKWMIYLYIGNMKELMWEHLLFHIKFSKCIMITHAYQNDKTSIRSAIILAT